MTFKPARASLLCHMNIQVYGYIRVSGAAQAEKDGPVRQQAALEEFCRAHGLGGMAIYSDLGVSGTIEGLDRPGFVRMIDDAKHSGVSCVVIERLDRLARDLIVSEFMMRELRSRGIRLYATDQGLNDMATADVDPSRKLIRQIFSAMAEYEKSALVIKLRSSRERMRRETGRCEGRKPYGNNRSELITLELIKNLRDSGISWGGIAALLKQNGTKKRNGGIEWSACEVFSFHKKYIKGHK